MSAVVSYTQAQSVEDVFGALAAGARPIAGGTDLVVGARQGKAPLPERLVSIDRIAELRELRHEAESSTVGAGVTHAVLAADPVVRESFTGLADASSIVGSHATQHVGTLGGNVMNASPAMETAAPLLCFDAEVSLGSREGVRKLGLEELIVGPGRTSAAAGELLLAIELSRPPAGSGSAYVRLQYRQQMEVAVVGAGARVTLDGGKVTEARLALTAVGPTIFRVREAERVLIGSMGTPEDLSSIASMVTAASQPISDLRGSAEYRREMIAVIARRALVAAIARAGGEEIPIPASVPPRSRGKGAS